MKVAERALPLMDDMAGDVMDAARRDAAGARGAVSGGVDRAPRGGA